jgi:Carboxypeptidase regulatory-like domain
MTTRMLPALAVVGALSLHGAASYEVGGVVVDSQSRRPLANARVALAPTTARVQKLEQVTNKDGRFSFVVREAGKYMLQITKPGYPAQSYRRSGIGGLSSAIVVHDGQDTSHIVFDANRGSAITGQIKDEDSEPVGNALVTIFQSAIVGGERKIVVRGQTRANAAGEFRIANLQRGSYYVCAMGRPWFADSIIQLQQIQETTNRQQRAAPQILPAAPAEPTGDQSPEPTIVPLPYSPDPGFRGTAFLTTFYPHGQSIEEAGLVPLDSGAEAQVSITLAFSKAVSVKGKIAFSGEMGAGRANLLKKVYDQYVSFLQETVSKDGSFQFVNVPAGSYEIVATSDAASGATSWNVRQQVEVGSSDVDVTLRPAFMGAVSGRVLFDGDPPATANLFVTLRNDQGNAVRIQVDTEGNFSLSRILPGRYEVAAGSADYVASYFAGPNGERLPLTLDITSGEPVRRDLMLTRAVSAIEGTVEKAGVPQVGAFVLLMPKNPSERWAYRSDQTDSDGSFRLAAIPSGDYFLIALSEGVDVVYRDAKVAAILAKAGKPVHIEPGDHSNLKVDVVDTATLNLPSL